MYNGRRICFMNEYKCKICNTEKSSFKSYDSLRKHMGRKHKINSTFFYVEFYLNGIWPLCKCGCGEKVKWSSLKGKFCELKHGHYSRIHNNWGHNKDAIKKSAETRRLQYKNGERNVWNEGLTKENDDRIKLYGKSISDSFTKERKKIYSNKMKENRINGIVPTLYGQQSSQWKGGISEINVMARSNKRLYDEWKYPILMRDGFKCKECGSTENLHIHHDKETMSEIVKKHVVDEEAKDFELKKSIAEKIVDYHIMNKTSGITLCKECHNKLHPSLNF